MPRTKVAVPDVAEAGPELWSNAIRAGDMLFISGQVARPFEGGTEIVGKDEYEQTRQIFSRIERIIKAAGGTMDNLVKMTIYVVDIKKNTEVWRARREFFTGDFPTSTLWKCGRLRSRTCWWRSKPSPILARAEVCRGHQPTSRSPRLPTRDLPSGKY
jgi:2-iminobutanoate/2-iminopropanoate deaminase